LAAACGILPWQPGEAERAAATCFAAWRGARPGGDVAGEDAAALAAVRAFLGAHAESRFQTISDEDAPPPQTASRRRSCGS
jgi:putative DNA primase/helicase